MNNIKQLKKIYVILIIISLFSIIPIMSTYFLLRDISIISNSLNTYISSCNSLFLPFIPSFTLLSISSTFQFGIGHIIDIIIIINVVSLIQTASYHYINMVYINRKFQLLIRIEFEEQMGEYHSQQSDENKKLLLDQERKIRFKNKKGKIFAFNTKLEKKKSVFWDKQLEKKSDSDQISKFLFSLNNNCNNLRFFYSCAFSEKSLIFRLTNYPHHINSNYAFFKDQLKQQCIKVNNY